MPIITLEEHIVFPELAQRTGDNSNLGSVAQLKEQLSDIDGERLKSMDDNGISLQVLSVVGPGADLLDGEAAIAMAFDYNNTLASAIEHYPTRFAAFAHLPMNLPGEAAKELKRAVQELKFCGALVNGMSHGHFLDEPQYQVLLEAAQELDVPIYLHPGLPPEAVKQAYYRSLPGESGERLSVAGWGWHSETAIHVLRLIISGTFDRYPKLKLIIGHMGEMLPMMMARCDTIFPPGEQASNQRTISQTLLDQVYITTSGIFTAPPFQTAMDTFGIDRILFSVDYPFARNEQGLEFLQAIRLDDAGREKLCWKNAADLLRLKL